VLLIPAIDLAKTRGWQLKAMLSERDITADLRSDSLSATLTMAISKSIHNWSGTTTVQNQRNSQRQDEAGTERDSSAILARSTGHCRASSLRVGYLPQHNL
jgi:hypothetical protein